MSTAADGLRTLTAGLKFPEAPRFHHGRLWISDLLSHEVLAIDSSGEREVMATFESDSPSGLGFLPDGRCLVALMRSRKIESVDAEGTVRTHCDLARMPGRRLNDMVVDGRGFAYLDSTTRRSEDGEDHRADFLLLVRPDGRASVAADGLTAPNGIAVSPQGDRLVVAEAAAHRLTQFDVGSDGSLNDRRLFAATGDASPDGICFDADGCVWFGSPHTSEFLRIAEGGAVSDGIAVPGRWAVACALGGTDGRELYLVTAVTTLRGVLQENESSGAIETTRVEVRGAGWP